jgi:hypothetical protein
MLAAMDNSLVIAGVNSTGASRFLQGTWSLSKQGRYVSAERTSGAGRRLFQQFAL